MPNPASVRVLIMDDNDVSRSMLRHILAKSVTGAMQLGAAGYIVKPFNPTTLLRTREQAVLKLNTAA